ncbi:MAG: hypothetical protein HQK55_06145, partial [Deltaproteobacteria bacterium]|nr:hypothetical protein [Deltaproteobacteria bacterium]
APQNHEIIKPLVEYEIRDLVFILNRAPSLHKYNLLAFRPVLTDELAIGLHPLACKSFNADFDGDTMSVLLPLSKEAQKEARNKLLFSKNLISNRNREIMPHLDQDIVLGIYLMTKGEDGRQEFRGLFLEAVCGFIVDKTRAQGFEELKKLLNKPAKKAGRKTAGLDEKLKDWGSKFIQDIEDRKHALQLLKKIDEIQYPIPGDFLKDLLQAYLEVMKKTKLVLELLQKIMDLGFRGATEKGVTFSLFDVPYLAENVRNQPPYLTDLERKEAENTENPELTLNRIQKEKVYTEIKNLMKPESGSDYSGSPIASMFNSGSKGKMEQIGQLGGMRGELQGMTGEALPFIKHNFREGIPPLEFCVGSQAGRKTMCEKKLSTAPAGAFTRNLIEGAYRVVVTEKDCGADSGLELRDLSKTEILLKELKDKVKVKGCMTMKEREVGRTALKSGLYRSVLTCRTNPPGVCAECYGQDLATGDEPAEGTPVGLIAGQAIGERGTQLTMRTFHTGGAKGSVEVADYTRLEKLLNNSPVDVKLFEVTFQDQANQWMENPSILDAWTLFLYLLYSDQPGVAELKKLEVSARRCLSEMKHLDYIRDILFLEAHLIYNAAVHDRHYEVLLRAIVNWNDSRVKEDLKATSRDHLASIRNLAYKQEKGRLDGDHKNLLIGLRKAAEEQPSFLAASSYRRALEILSKAALEEKDDNLIGLKERLIIGQPGVK